MPLSFLPQRRIRWRLIAAIFCLALIGGTTFFQWWYERRWQGRIFPGVRIGVVAVGGKTKKEARPLLEQTTETIMRAGLSFTYQSARVTIAPILSAPEDPDLTYEIIRWDTDAMLDHAFSIGHEGQWWKRWYAQTRALFSGVESAGVVTVEKEKLERALQENFVKMEEPAKDAQLIVAQGAVTVAPEALGKVFDYASAVRTTEEMLTQLMAQPVALSLLADYPTITAEMLSPLVSEAEELVARGPIQFIYGNRWWRIHPEEWGTWLTVVKESGAPTIIFDEKKVSSALAPIAEIIDQPSRDAKFVVRNGRVVEFQTAQTGKRLSVAKTVERTAQNVIKGNALTIAVVVEELVPSVADRDVQDLNIVDLIGVGRSNFKGSPVNRRHNITVGARSLNGLLIAPGEEFSLLKALGDIDAEAGYKPELVIKGNRTIPEFGGGLCQIGTTTFRAALASGLPITERQNHSYSVPYYLENGKPGVDATIYGPKPDFKFINDTGNTILIQTRIKGDDLFFEFWGKKDGRIAERTEPKVTNVRKPSPTKIIETEDLPPGKKKCTERAHTGATAEFTYMVTMPDGEKREKVFRSVYRPWQEVCLVGKAKVAEPEEEAPARNASQGDAGGDNADTVQALPSADTEGVRGE